MPKPYQDLTNQKFGLLTPINLLPKTSPKSKTKWLCICDCGNECIVNQGDLKSGNTVSCGCYRLKRLKQKCCTHNQSNTKLYKVWRNMKNRCYNKKDTEFHNYGARGIIISPEWKNSFQNFYTWAIKNGYKDKLTIDRIDVNGNYEPSNCRWADTHVQGNNRRNNINITYNGETHTLTEWAQILDIKYSMLRKRLNNGWNIKRAFTLPKQKNQFG